MTLLVATLGCLCALGPAGADCIDYGDYLRLAGSVDTPSGAFGVAVSGGYAYVAADFSGLQVIDITDPQNPQIVGSVDTPCVAHEVALAGAFAYVADEVSGLQVVDITNPQNPTIVGSVWTGGAAADVAVSDAFVYVADYSDKVVVLSKQCEPVSQVAGDQQAVSVVMLDVCPNPGTGLTAIRFVTRSRGSVRASVYDIGGRSVRALSDGILDAGGHDLLWDGRGENGRALPAGSYLVRVSTTEESRTARIVLLR